jgi:hypothetical protein
MRVRPLLPTDRRPARAARRRHVLVAPPAAAPAAPAPSASEHPDEQRHAASVHCEDIALYSCSCGFQFQAPVSTSVACPHCGTGQAW